MKKINPQDLTEYQIQAAARIAYRSIQKFFDNPENEKKFERWKTQRANAEKRKPIGEIRFATIMPQEATHD